MQLKEKVFCWAITFYYWKCESCIPRLTAKETVVGIEFIDVADWKYQWATCNDGSCRYRFKNRGIWGKPFLLKSDKLTPLTL